MKALYSLIAVLAIAAIGWMPAQAPGLRAERVAVLGMRQLDQRQSALALGAPL